uniref:protein arginine N-methyltransferase 9 isoform X2 n=1 Tax=Myxine glutinosa TaxID=7769 RepID=UPI00358F0D8E
MHHLWTTCLWLSTTHGPHGLGHGPSAGIGQVGQRKILLADLGHVAPMPHSLGFCDEAAAWFLRAERQGQRQRRDPAKTRVVQLRSPSGSESTSDLSSDSDPNFKSERSENLVEPRTNMKVFSEFDTQLAESHKSDLEASAFGMLLENANSTRMLNSRLQFDLGDNKGSKSDFGSGIPTGLSMKQARENFERAAGCLVQRWHFLMLNDHQRNVAFRDAVRAAVQAGAHTVLDIGTGTGLLSLFAADEGAAVWAVEVSVPMARLARHVTSFHGLAHRVRVLEAHSTQLTIPRDLPKRVSLVVTETVDAGLLGEGIVETLIHAWKYLLLPPQHDGTPDFEHYGRVIPAGATVFVCGLECPAIRRQHRLCVQNVCGLKVPPRMYFQSIVCGKDMFLEAFGDDEDCDLDSMRWEPYTTERLSRVPGGFVPLFQPTAALFVDFNSLTDLVGLLSRAPWHSLMEVERSGTLDVLAAWFNLQLDDEFSLSTEPGTNTCWEQAIFPIHGPQMCVQAGDSVQVSTSCQDGYLQVTCEGIAPPEKTSQCFDDDPNSSSTLTWTLPPTEASVPQSTADFTVILQPWELLRLNDVEFWECANLAVEDVFGERRRGHVDGKHSPVVLDLTEGLSLLPLLMVRCGGCVVSAYPRRQDSMEAVFKLAKANGLPTNNLRFLDPLDMDDKLFGINISASSRKIERLMHFNSLQSFLEIDQKSNLNAQGMEEVSASAAPDSRALTQDGSSDAHGSLSANLEAEVGSSSQQPLNCGTISGNPIHENGDVPQGSREGIQDLWDVVVLDAVETCGIIREGIIQKAIVARSMLKPGGRIFPHCIVVMGQLVQSEALEKQGAVQGKNPTLGYNIAPFVNLYAVPLQQNVHLDTLPHRALSHPTVLLQLDLMVCRSTLMERTTKVCITAAGKASAIALWLDLGLSSNAPRISASRPSSHILQTATLVQPEWVVSPGQSIHVRTTCRDGCLDVQLDTI